MLKLNFSPFPNLSTERLSLRKITIEDAEDIYTLRSDDRVNKFLDRAKANSVEDANNFINQIRSRGSNNELLYWAITQKKDSKLIGTIVYWNISPETSSGEIGFELHPDFQGKGLMREALEKVVDYGLNEIGFQTIEAYPEAANEKSIVLLERANFKKDEAHAEQGASGKTVRYVIGK